MACFQVFSSCLVVLLVFRIFESHLSLEACKDCLSKKLRSLEELALVCSNSENPKLSCAFEDLAACYVRPCDLGLSLAQDHVKGKCAEPSSADISRSINNLLRLFGKGDRVVMIRVVHLLATLGNIEHKSLTNSCWLVSVNSGAFYIDLVCIVHSSTFPIATALCIENGCIATIATFAATLALLALREVIGPTRTAPIRPLTVVRLCRLPSIWTGCGPPGRAARPSRAVNGPSLIRYDFTSTARPKPSGPFRWWPRRAPPRNPGRRGRRVCRRARRRSPRSCCVTAPAVRWLPPPRRRVLWRGCPATPPLLSSTPPASQLGVPIRRARPQRTPPFMQVALVLPSHLRCRVPRIWGILPQLR